MTENPKNSFEIVGEAMDQQDAMQTMMRIGQFRALGAVGAMTSALAAREIKRLKAEKAYKLFGLDWEQFCPRFLGVSRPTADGQIKKLEEFGEMFFALGDITRINEQTFRAIEGSITDTGEIEFGNEVVKIDKSNAPRIREIVAHFQDEIRKEKQRASDARHDAKMTAEQRDEARKDAKRERERLADYQRKQERLHPDLSANQNRLRLAQNRVMGACMEMRAVRDADITSQEYAELKGLWAWAIEQICDAADQLLDPMQAELLEPVNLLESDAKRRSA